MTLVACDADMNNGGFLNTVDVGISINMYMAGEPVSDLSGESNVNSIHITVFINLYTQTQDAAGLSQPSF
jgi:hypothetical protein